MTTVISCDEDCPHCGEDDACTLGAGHTARHSCPMCGNTW